jgi:UDP-N-acetylmuramyl pentapeptide phosphotransferase/UDP-N-acetylglucosamine-1-phosphate transferase
MIVYPIIAILLFGAELLYFRLADHYNIIDHPNERSSHTRITIRGGGMIFLLAAVCMAVMHPAHWPAASGILLIGIISFLDDMHTLSSGIRITVHFIAVTLMFFYLNLFGTLPFYISALLYVMVIGVINMYNFMDGINGITGAYSLVVLAGLQYVNLERTDFTDPDMIWLPILACVVFLFFNFRTNARCFAGDVGSVTIAFWIIMLLMRLIYVSNNWVYILFLVVYGVDSALTVVHRLIRGENILKAHRLHFYQILANERKVPHLLVSTGYAVVQAGIIAFIVTSGNMSIVTCFALTIVPLVVVYIALKPWLMKARKYQG